MTDRLSLACPAPPVVQSLEWDKHRLETSLAEAPGLGRSLLAGYRSSADAPFEADSRAGPRFAGAASARDALTACAAGSTRLARDVLLFLGRHLDASGRALGDCSTGGAPRHDDPEATPLYLLLAARYAAWTGDLGTLRAEWPRLLRARHAAIRDDPGAAASSLLGCALAELAPAAEAIGEGEASSELRREAGLRGGLPWGLERGLETSIGRLVHGMLGAEPDATRGRLVLRPDPPPAWRAFTVGGLVVGSAAVSLRYRREGGRHAFRLAQERGAVPLRVILEPRLPGGRLRRAAVDGVEAELDARPEGDKLVVPVQVVLDHGREVVLEPDGSAEMERRRD